MDETVSNTAPFPTNNGDTSFPRKKSNLKNLIDWVDRRKTEGQIFVNICGYFQRNEFHVTNCDIILGGGERRAERQ
jgi:hypothetical protein